MPMKLYLLSPRCDLIDRCCNRHIRQLFKAGSVTLCSFGTANGSVLKSNIAKPWKSTCGDASTTKWYPFRTEMTPHNLPLLAALDTINNLNFALHNQYLVLYGLPGAPNNAERRRLLPRIGADVGI